MTLIEMMIVLAVIGMLLMLARSGFRTVTKADLVENATELSAVLRRTRLLAIEHGELHRVTIDFDRDPDRDDMKKVPDYIVEVCKGATGLVRNEAVRPDEEAKKRAVERGNERMRNMPANAFAPADPDEAQRRATALAGHHVADRSCVPATDSLTGDATGKGWARQLRKHGRDSHNNWTGVHFKQMWIAHRDDVVQKGQVAIYFWPTGSSEKTVLELADGDDVFTVIVGGLTGRIDLLDGPVQDPTSYMLKNVMGDKDAAREGTP
jgi:prepilin-type N-terminal cleavage/methylation domain-containing protein